jgi:hypothetical protein
MVEQLARRHDAEERDRLGCQKESERRKFQRETDDTAEACTDRVGDIECRPMLEHRKSHVRVVVRLGDAAK